MKKLGFKLLLSGVALAACAATLSTTTYAWYVSNDTAKATNIAGTTAGATATGNLLLAKNKATNDTTHPGSYAQNISFGGTGETMLTVPTNGMTPMSKDVQGSGTEGESGYVAPLMPKDVTTPAWHDVELNVVNGDTNSIMFDIWVLSTKANTVTPTLTTKNMTGLNADGSALTGFNLDSLKQTCYNATNSAPVEQGETFVIDAVEALRMEITQFDLKEDGSLNTTATSSTVYSVKDISTDYNETRFTSATEGKTPDAQAYYKALLGNDPKGGATLADTEAEQSLSAIRVTPGKAFKLSFRIWLEGRDSMCFDSCSGQKFNFELTFKATNVTTPAA